METHPSANGLWTEIIAPLTEMGASITGRGDSGSLAPLTIEGRPLRGIEYTLPVASAQVKSAVLLAALRAEGPSTVHETVPTRAHTEEMLAAAGVRLERGDCSVTLWPGEVDPPDVEVPGDPSQAAFWVVGACTAPNSDLTVENVYLGPARGGFVEVLQRMGADITVDEDSGDIEARSSELRGTLVTAQELPGCIDEVPILAVAAAAAEGTTVFEGSMNCGSKRPTGWRRSPSCLPSWVQDASRWRHAGDHRSRSRRGIGQRYCGLPWRPPDGHGRGHRRSSGQRLDDG